jgi:hypothetical protein
METNRVERHGGKTMWIERVKNVPVPTIPLFPLRFPGAMMFNFKHVLLWKQKTIHMTTAANCFHIIGR